MQSERKGSSRASGYCDTLCAAGKEARNGTRRRPVARKDVMSDQTILVTGAADFIRSGLTNFLFARTTGAIKAVFGGVPIRRFNHGTMRRDFAHIDGVICVVLRPVDQIGRDDGAARVLHPILQSSSGSADRCGSGSGERNGPHCGQG